MIPNAAAVVVAVSRQRAQKKDETPMKVRSAAVVLFFLFATPLTMESAMSSPADDAKAVADLDTQYQKAVKENDVATMDKILLDDFVLVTGNGTVYNKADLLKSARDKEIIW